MHHTLPRRGHCQPFPRRHHHRLQYPMHVSRTSLSSSTLGWFLWKSISGAMLIFVEIPLLMRICPTSPKFDEFMRRFSSNYMRAAIYGVMSLVQWLSLLRFASSLIAAAVLLMFAGIFYAIAGLRHHDFAGSKTLGGQGVAQMIVWGRSGVSIALWIPRILAVVRVENNGGREIGMRISAGFVIQG